MNDPLRQTTAKKPQPTQALEITTYPYGEDILREGEECSFFFVILSGQVRVSRKGTKIRVLDEQDIFGLENLIFRKPSYYTVSALNTCRVAKYGPEALDHLIHESPRMVNSLLMSVLYQLAQTSSLVSTPQEFAMPDVRVRFFRDGEAVGGNEARGPEFYRLVSTQGGLRVTIGGDEISRIEKPGEFFGGVAGMFGLPAGAVISSIGESVIEIYDMDDLDILIRDHPEMVRKMLRTLLSRAAELERKPEGTRPAGSPSDATGARAV